MFFVYLMCWTCSYFGFGFFFRDMALLPKSTLVNGCAAALGKESVARWLEYCLVSDPLSEETHHVFPQSHTTKTGAIFGWLHFALWLSFDFECNVVHKSDHGWGGWRVYGAFKSKLEHIRTQIWQSENEICFSSSAPYFWNGRKCQRPVLESWKWFCVFKMSSMPRM